ncbi:exonuclease domain-containing protein [Undibacterium sp. JH2W]|uniref:exonuclease domain-containing protein n=1 Tax=Undibacterium sp. JH2W TaxID=3413037 RepID=UPI003BF1F189
MKKIKNYLVIDFEATCCDQGSVPREHMEIIEFGCVMVDASDFVIVSEFQSFVRPARHAQLTAFCRSLTSISQQEVDAAPGFKEVVTQFKHWLYQYQDFVFCSWGDYDRKQLQQDCGFHRVPNPIGAAHINLKPLMSERFNLNKKLGLGQAIRHAGLEFSGTAHRGIDDARNIARLLPFLFEASAGQ